MIELKDKKVLITGGSRGIGPVIAESLKIRGAYVALAARSESGLQDVAERLSKTGSKVYIVPVDLNIQSQREMLIDSVLKEVGTIDILINNAGLETEGAYVELSWTEIKETVEINLIAPMALVRLLLPSMLKNKTGHIINIASIAAKSGAPYAAVYSGTKAGLAEWTRGLRLELKGTGIHFSTIFPGYVREVGMFARFGKKSPWIIGSCSPEQVAKAVLKAIQKGKIEEIVNSRQLRYSFIINELSPKLGDWLMQISGAVAFQRRKIGK
ncbi:MAG TPA: ketoacyl reductase [Bacteroidales bacterium]|nr:ketoacyl reductase [Bacteroidales bacterium]